MKPWFWLAALVMMAVSMGVQSQNRPFDESYYNQAVEHRSGRLDGELAIITPIWEMPPLLYSIETDGAFEVIDGETGQRVIHGRLQSDGTPEIVDNDKPKPPKRPGGVGRAGRTLGVCFVGESISLGRCALQCQGSGVSEFSGGICGVQSICKCNAPPPSPPTPPPPAPDPSSFAPPWQTIPDFWGDSGQCGIFHVCDSLDPL